MTHVLDARNATFAQWVPHQGNYMTQMLLFDISLAVPKEEQLERYTQITGVDHADSAYNPNLLRLVQLDREVVAPLTAADVEVVADALERWFAVVGLLDRFDESVALFDAALGLGLAPHASTSRVDHGSGANAEAAVGGGGGETHGGEMGALLAEVRTDV